jgi:hypothetical protein
MCETVLHPTVKRFPEIAVFRVKGEVNGCDVVAVRDGVPLQVTIAEMKLGFSLALLLQTVDRMRAADEVWLASRPPGEVVTEIGVYTASAD